MVAANGTLTGETSICSNVTQTVMGSLLFVVEVSDMFSATLTSYTDDTEGVRDAVDLIKTQKNLHVGMMKITCNPLLRSFKCSTIKPQLEYISAIPEPELVRDLRIHMSNDAAFYIHITKLALLCR